MKGGNVQEFLDTLSLGVEKEFKFRGATFFAQGTLEDSVWTMTLDRWDPPADDYIWSYQAKTMQECHEAFLEAPIFEGLTFWEAEKEMEWIGG